MTKLTVMGRKFCFSPAGYLLDGDDMPTDIFFNTISVKMEAQAGKQMFPDIQPNDHIAFTDDGYLHSAFNAPKPVHHRYLLIRDGRCVAQHRPYDGLMID